MPDFDKLTAALAVVARAIDEGMIKPVLCPRRAWVVLRHPGEPSPEMMDELRRNASDVFGGRKVIVLVENMNIDVIDAPVEKTVREETL